MARGNVTLIGLLCGTLLLLLACALPAARANTCTNRRNFPFAVNRNSTEAKRAARLVARQAVGVVAPAVGGRCRWVPGGFGATCMGLGVCGGELAVLFLCCLHLLCAEAHTAAEPLQPSRPRTALQLIPSLSLIPRNWRPPLTSPAHHLPLPDCLACSLDDDDDDDIQIRRICKTRVSGPAEKLEGRGERGGVPTAVAQVPTAGGQRAVASTTQPLQAPASAAWVPTCAMRLPSSYYIPMCARDRWAPAAMQYDCRGLTCPEPRLPVCIPTALASHCCR